ncbi:MAG: hypothetical protein KJN63_05170 [Acidimicrobiia bacterium]|nr:hypothetical protein [Acidimicrobiia bacterium]
MDKSAEPSVWCDECSAYRPAAPTCRECGHLLEREREIRVGDSAPWHFWLVVVALAGYLLWRLVQGIWWLVA